MNAEFKNRQIAIFNAEQVLHVTTEKLLLDILKVLTDEQLNELDAYPFSDFEEFQSYEKESQNFVIFDTDMDEEKNVDISDLSQEQQKDLIDTIMVQIFNM